MALSSFVMERITASTRFIADSSISAPSFSLGIPGIMFRILFMPPIFLIWFICSRKSLKSKSALRSFRLISLAFVSSISASAFSISERMSPIPNMRDAIRSG